MKTIKDEFPHLPDRIAGLGELAENLWWSWNPAARMKTAVNGVAQFSILNGWWIEGFNIWFR